MSEIIPPIIMTVIALAIAAVLAYRARKTAGWAVFINSFAATQVLMFMVPHTLGSVGARLTGKTKAVGSLIHMNILGVDYDFRLYALALVGVVFVVQAGKMLRVNGAIRRGDTHAARLSRNVSLVIIALAIPLAPISPGIPFLITPAILNVIRTFMTAGPAPAQVEAIS